MSKSRIVDEQGTPKALLPSKSDAGYPAKKGKNPKPQEKPTYRSTMELPKEKFIAGDLTSLMKVARGEM